MHLGPPSFTIKSERWPLASQYSIISGGVSQEDGARCILNQTRGVMLKMNGYSAKSFEYVN